MVEKDERRFRPDYAIPPGETIREKIQDIGMSQAELARRLRLTPVHCNEVIQGNKPITLETALRLEAVLGIPAYLWINLQSQYDETKARIAKEESIVKEVALAKKFPYGEMARLGWVSKTRDWKERVCILQSYFAVSSLELVPKFHEAAYRTSKTKKASPESLAAWLRRGEIEAQKIDTQPYDEALLRAAIPELRRLTKENPEVFQPRIEQICGSFGIALVFLPHLKGTYAHGATKWVSPHKALVILSIRYKWADIFWFSFFHEIGHILRHKKRSVFIEYVEKEESQEEIEADKFAAETLVPSKSLSELPEDPYPTQKEIVGLASELGIAPGIIVGRLQHKGIIPPSHYNALRERYRWAT